MMNENTKTIKELAEELGVSKQAIQYHIKYLANKNRQTNDKGITVLSEEEQDFIRNRVDKPTNKTKTNKPTKNRQKTDKRNETDINQYLLNEIEEVKKNRDRQLSVKDKQIENKDIQISQMQNLLDQQQRLALQDKKLLEEYKSEINKLKALKMSSEDILREEVNNQPQEELERLKSEKKDLQEQLSKQATIEQQEVSKKPKKWWQIWK